MSIPMKI
ncbi:hypothetical protein ACS0PU_009272 [Formica fusca]